MKRWLKISLKIVGALSIMFILFWTAAAYYIHQNNKAILAKILAQVNTTVKGTIKVSHMETTLLKGFPGVSVSLKNVSLRDSLWGQHQHDLLNAKDIDISLNVLSLLVGTINIRKIAINNASIYLYTATNGYSNAEMFSKANTAQKNYENSNSALQIRLIDFNKVDLVIDNQKRFKLFSFYVNELKGKIKYPLGRWDGDFKVNILIRSFAFNTLKGSFLKDKTISGNMKAHYDDGGEIIIIDQKPIKIGNDTFSIGANINTAKNNSAFSIAIRADKLLYLNVAKLLAPNISSKLLKFDLAKPIDITASIIDDGSKSSRDPLINVSIKVKENTVTIPSGELQQCSFTGFFTNKDTTNRPIGDANSLIRFYDLKANYYGAPIRVDTFSITNLEKPIAKGLVTSKFELKQLNEYFEEENFKFGKGTADLSLFCQADIDSFLFTKPVIHGKVAIKNADITYLPRNLKLINNSVELNFNHKDLNISNSKFQLGNSILTVNCTIANFLNFYYTDPQKIDINVSLNSPNLHLSELVPFLSPRQTKHRKSSTKNALKVASVQLSTALESSKVHLMLNVNRIVYNNFVANKVKANISLIGNGVYLNKMTALHAGGNIKANGKIEQQGTINKLNFNASVNRVSVKDFFYAFDNFGQQSVTSKNLAGFLSANVNAAGNITTKGNLVPKSMYGKVNFTLDQAALVGFEPLEKVGKFIFRSRNLSNIALEKLSGKLTLRGDHVDISPMKVNSTAINFDVKGVYGFNSGTNIALDIPLRDPKKSAQIIDPEERELARMKGIVLHLKAVDENGTLKIKWNKKKDRE